jgi:hypothetical protein
MARNSRTSLASLTFFCFWTWIAVSRHQIAAHRVSSDSEKRSRRPQTVCLPRSSMNRSRFLRACRLSSAPGEHPKIESVAACCRGRNTSKRASVGKRGRAASKYQRAAQRMTRDGENTAVCRASSTTQNEEESRLSSTTRPRC